jgi:hypothetical protein
MKLRVLFFLVVFGFAFASANKAQAQDFRDLEYRVHTIFIYNFTKYISWPSSKSRGNFVIAVIGETKLTNELQRMAKLKTVGGRKIQIKKYSSMNEFTDAHILVLPIGSSDLLSQAIRKAGKDCLIVTQKEGLARLGSYINFVSVNGKPRFELNNGAISRSELRVANQLKAIAIQI